MTEKIHPFRRRPLRFVMQKLSIPAFDLLTRLEINGAENLPKEGPLLVVGNHFSFIDPVTFVRLAPWPLDFVGGAANPHAPLWTRIIPFLWGYLGDHSPAGTARDRFPGCPHWSAPPACRSRRVHRSFSFAVPG
jgi:hypothetical protein